MRRGPTQPSRSERSRSLRCSIGPQELFHRCGNFDYVRLKRKMSGVQELDPRVRDVPSKSLGPRGKEKGVVFTPNRQQRRLHLPEVVLKRRVELHVRGVVAKQIELDVLV